ncbi:transcriptional regulator [Rubellimicrobium sp. CFH 75288]|uniref:transcriptional regulator n=1 Tax=Rubellimicrobium sp. CFH 75288 TaxID=2697034 RepID=UPI00141350CF|nr:transcriptional regulator [Rubellimicrobium sp. CFH 75288]NAZ35682.1 transcriptional regulator [Rubellimicrobium sp. CFH 75288]
MLRLLLSVILLSGLAWPARALELVMVEQAGCAWCARWDREVAPEYPLTEEGQAAPLRRIDLHQPVPDDLVLQSRPRLTPTFVLVDDEGRELGRIEGYPGEDFFWGLLGVLLERAGWSRTEQD